MKEVDERFAIPNEDVHHVLTVCGIGTDVEHQVFILVEGLNSLDSFGDLSGDNDVTEMAKRLAGRPVVNGHVIVGTKHIKRIQGLVHWVKDHQKRNLVTDYLEWDAGTMQAAMDRKESQKNFENVDIDMIDPGKCNTDHGAMDGMLSRLAS
jgi:hypothetical protein